MHTALILGKLTCAKDVINEWLSTKINLIIEHKLIMQVYLIFAQKDKIRFLIAPVKERVYYS